MGQTPLVPASAVCCAYLLLAVTLEGTSAFSRLDGAGDSVDVNGKEDSTVPLHEILASDAKSFLRLRTRMRVRRYLWQDTGEEEGEGEEEESLSSRERNRETNERNNEVNMWQQCAPTCWGSWSAYSSCTDPCGNSGLQTATRQIAPPPSCSSWVARYGCQGTSSRTQACNRMCYNGGTPRNSWCSCAAWFRGSCCETRFCVESGTQLNSTGTCSLCPRGTYRDAPVHTRCESCPPGWTTFTTGARSQDQCTVRNCLPHGTELNEADDCQKCSIGYFRNASVHSACVPCPRHWTSPSTGSSSETNCSILHCDAGHEGLQVQGACTECAVGYYKSYPGAGLCTPCPSGYTTSGNGSTSERHCFDDTPPSVTSQVLKIDVISGGGVAGLIVVVVVVVAAVCIRKRRHKPKGNPGSRGDSKGNPGSRGDSKGNPGSRGDSKGNPGSRGDSKGNPGSRGESKGNPGSPGDSKGNPGSPGDSKGNPGSPGDSSYDEIDISRMYGIEDYDDGIERHKVSKHEHVYAVFTPEVNEGNPARRGQYVRSRDDEGQVNDGVPHGTRRQGQPERPLNSVLSELKIEIHLHCEPRWDGH